MCCFLTLGFSCIFCFLDEMIFCESVMALHTVFGSVLLQSAESITLPMSLWRTLLCLFANTFSKMYCMSHPLDLQKSQNSSKSQTCQRHVVQVCYFLVCHQVLIVTTAKRDSQRKLRDNHHASPVAHVYACNLETKGLWGPGVGWMEPTDFGESSAGPRLN